MSDHLIAERTERVRARLVEHYTEIGCTIKSMSKFEWTTNTTLDPSNLHKPYGWLPPFAAETQDAGSTVFDVIAPFCPALIAEQTADLDDEQFEEYMNGVEYITALHVVYREVPWEERERIIESRTWEEGEDTLRLMGQVQMSVLDKMHGS